jgi:hypothetical integral membrane protein (TIGR02206 family)
VRARLLGDLRDFSAQHLAALAVILATSGACVYAARRRPGPLAVLLCRGLAVVILGGWLAEYSADVALGIWGAEYDLPFQLTDLVTVVSAFALLTRRALLVELTYFWALTATLQAVVTPDLASPFPSVFYFTYFAYHGGAIAAACLLVFGCRLHPRRGAVRRVYAASVAWTAVAAVADIATGGNYMYLREKPARGTVLDVMGPWPWYVASTALLGLGLLVTVSLITTAICRGPSRAIRPPA